MAGDSLLRRLRSHELGLCPSNYRSSLRLLASLIKDPGSRYELVWQQRSQRAIFFEDHKIFLNDFTHTYSLWGWGAKPGLLFRQPSKISFEEVIVYSTKINRVPAPAALFAPLLLGLTRNNMLLRFHAWTGEQLNSVHLGPMYKFHNISWQVTGETLLLQSVYFKKCGFKSQTCLQAIAFLDINPFRFSGMLELTTTLFGNKAQNANVGEDILIIGLGSHGVRLYSMRAIMSDEYCQRLCSCNFGQSCTRSGSQGHGPIGAEGFGLPITHQLHSLPPVLFEIKTDDQSVHFGAFPMQYLFKPVRGHKVKLVNLMTDVESGELEVTDTATGSDVCVFHYDESSRVLHARPHFLQVLRVCELLTCSVKADPDADFPSLVEPDQCSVAATIRPQFVVKPLPDPERVGVKVEPVSPVRRNPRRERRCVQPSYADDTDRRLFRFDHENELDFLSVLGIAEDQSSSVCMFDNSDGSFVKRIPVESLQEDDEYKFVVDLDHVVLIQKVKASHENRVFVYQLRRDEHVTSAAPAQNKNKKASKRKAGCLLTPDESNGSEYLKVSRKDRRRT